VSLSVFRAASLPLINGRENSANRLDDVSNGSHCDRLPTCLHRGLIYAKFQAPKLRLLHGSDIF
jgi:hypothetical protein